jgi:hypothetical protein
MLAPACFGDKRHDSTDREGETRRGPEAADATRRSSPHEPVSDGAAGHLLLTLELGETGIRLLASQRVALPLPTRRRNVTGAIRVEVISKDDQVVYSAFIDDPRPLRGEFSNGDTMEAVHVERATATFIARLPLTEDASWIRFVTSKSGAELDKLAYSGLEP